MTRIRSLFQQGYQRRQPFTLFRSSFVVYISDDNSAASCSFSIASTSQTASVPLPDPSRLAPNAVTLSARLPLFDTSHSISCKPLGIKALRQQPHERCVTATTVPSRGTASSTSFAIRGPSFVRSFSGLFVTPPQSCSRASRLKTRVHHSQGRLATTASHTYRQTYPLSYRDSPLSSFLFEKHLCTGFHGGKKAFSSIPQTSAEAAPAMNPPRQSSAAPVTVTTEALDKPSLDDRSYRVIELENGLEALLVHDAETDKASASLDVGVGNFSDDNDMPGTAHAVEHVSWLFSFVPLVSFAPLLFPSSPLL